MARLTRPARHGPVACSRGPRGSEAGLGATPTRRSATHRARGDGGTRTQSGLRGTADDERLQHELQLESSKVGDGGGGAHRRDRRRRSSTAVKVSPSWFGK
jgi:hypothetical protein